MLRRRVRLDPLTGDAPALVVDPDEFRNTYNISAFCSINRNKPAPSWFDIHRESDDMLNVCWTQRVVHYEIISGTILMS
jgi:mRNA-degrading endonuclease toxin of MazEF toxin-antitoxin module